MVKETLMLLSTQIEERRKEMLESMGRGTDKFEAYQHACGEVRGYMIVQSMISEALRANENSEENFDSTPTDNVVTLEKK
jgi:hypothetical protein|tara:strand:+ start:882 stop:1121 length:240 start_codon:yes stop_codon:yes gene_type:complete